jgi:hypothetical protein
MAVRKRWMVILFALASILAFLAAVPWLLDRQADLNNHSRFHDMTAQQLDSDVRANLPLGSTLALVEGVLRTKGMSFSFDPAAHRIQAGANRVKGSNWLIYESVGYTFLFDDSSRLKAITSKVYFTGP